MVRKTVIAQPLLAGNEREYVNQCVETNWISSQGRFVSEFESKFGSYIGTEFSLATSNGTTALHLALTAIGIETGDEVLVPDLTFAATANAVIHCGAKPVLVDVDRQSWTICTDDLRAKITDRTRAVIPVHLYGLPADMTAIMAIARERNIYVIEDCAESIGATQKGVLTGDIGDIGCFSFFANKIMTTGEGGMVTTSNSELYEKMKLLRDHGMKPERRYWHEVAGYNYRLTNIQAAIGVAQLEQLPSFLSYRDDIAKWYRDGLSGLPGIQFPCVVEEGKSVNWLFSIVIDQNVYGTNSSDLQDYLSRHQIESRPFFCPLHRQPPYKDRVEMPGSVYLADNGISLPTFVNLDKGSVDYICSLIRGFAS